MLARKLSPFKFKHGFRLAFITSSSQVSKFQSLNSHLLSNFNSTTYNQYPHQSPSNLPRFFTSESQTCLKFIREGNFDVNTSQNHLVCPGCGVHMQGLDPKLPGYFLKPSEKKPDFIMKLNRELTCEITNSIKMGNLGEIDDAETEISDSIKRGNLDEVGEPEKEKLGLPKATEFDSKPVVCARCHSLRYRRRVNDATVENLLPAFDFDHTIGRKLVSASGAQSIVLLVVDAVDFDGSFPRKVASTINENSVDWKQGKSGNVPRVVLVVTKIDLLPPCVSPTRLEDWVRTRAREGGANNVTSVHLVSAVRGWGLKHLVDDVCKLAGARGNVWAVGSQNAGKSTLINSISRHTSGEEVTELTEAPVPGTTLGIIRVEGVLPGEAKLFDTPGLLHPHQLTTRLTWEEQKLVQIRKQLKPRTYRIKAGYTVHIAGLLRLSVEETSLDTVYVTVWASPDLPLHMGKPKHVDTMLEHHFGRRLQPPMNVERVKEFGNWARKEFHVSGSSWDVSSIDVSVSGVGWFAVGLKGEARLGVWTYDGIDVTLRNSLIPQRSNYFQVPGFLECKKQKKLKQRKETVSDSSPLPDNAADTSSC
ncbi:hypothetical protein MKW98_028840 [Papaver atlanticum]|uniref:G domain-containing protein n=1 Tax=Papaver atlanticum TaxID=357466 RepID=A0AAD4S307_9MAGN|nr:hypothetical protein MKW98_028840 [Papaver atlanticum]